MRFRSAPRHAVHRRLGRFGAICNELPDALRSYAVRWSPAHLLVVDADDEVHGLLLDLSFMAGHVSAHDDAHVPLAVWRRLGLTRAEDGYIRAVEALPSSAEVGEQVCEEVGVVASFLREAARPAGVIALRRWFLEGCGERPTERTLHARLEVAKAHVELGDVVTGRAEAERALRESEAVELTDETRAVVYNNVGRGRMDAGDLDAAEEAYHRSLTLRPGDWRTRDNLGIVQLQRARFAEAAATFLQAHEDAAAAMGADSIDALAILSDLATARSGDGRKEEALELTRRAAEGLAARLGPGHPRPLRAQLNRVTMLRDLRRLPEAAALLEVAERHARELSAGHALLESVLKARAQLALAMGDDARAASSARDAADRLAARSAPARDEGELRVTLALALTKLGKAEEAAEAADVAIAKLTEGCGPDHERTLSFRVRLAGARARGDAGWLVEELCAARAALRAMWGPQHRLLAAMEATGVAACQATSETDPPATLRTDPPSG